MVVNHGQKHYSTPLVIYLLLWLYVFVGLLLSAFFAFAFLGRMGHRLAEMIESLVITWRMIEDGFKYVTNLLATPRESGV